MMPPHRRTQSLAIALMLLAFLPWPANAAPGDAEGQTDNPPAAKPAGETKSLDDQLLEGLESELLEGLDDAEEEPAAKKQSDKQPAEESPAKKPVDDSAGKRPSKSASKLDEELERNLGEDIGLGSEENPLTRIGKKMRAAEELIAQRKAAEPTQQLQEQALKELDQLLEELRKQQQSNQQQGGVSKPKGSRRSPVKQSAKQPGTEAGKTAKEPAKDSTDRTGKDETAKVNKADMRDMQQEVWGNLPERIRQEMLQNAAEEFLPEYSHLISEYFRLLAEGAEDDGK